MKYRAECSLTDFDGCFYESGAVVELDESVRHSSHLIVIQSVDKAATLAAEKKNEKTVKEAEARQQEAALLKQGNLQI